MPHFTIASNTKVKVLVREGGEWREGGRGMREGIREGSEGRRGMGGE